MADAGIMDVPLSPVERLRAADAARAAGGLYRDLLLAARHFADCAQHCEATAPRAMTGAAAVAGVRHRSYVTGAILSACAFLEASINELYVELHTRSSEQSPLPRGMVAVLSRFWSHAEHAPVLHRYQVMLTVADAERFNEKQEPFHNADSLLKLRDALVHSAPERAENRRRARALEQRLHQRFAVNPFAAADAPWFPDVCLSTSCAEWAVQSADALSEEFCRRLTLPPRGLKRADMEARAAAASVRMRSMAPNDDVEVRARPNGSSPR